MFGVISKQANNPNDPCTIEQLIRAGCNIYWGKESIILPDKEKCNESP